MTELQLLASFGVEFIESFLAYLVRASSIHTSIIALAGVLHRRGHKYKYLMIPPDFDIDFSLFSFLFSLSRVIFLKLPRCVFLPL